MSDLLVKGAESPTLATSDMVATLGATYLMTEEVEPGTYALLPFKVNKEFPGRTRVTFAGPRFNVSFGLYNLGNFLVDGKNFTVALNGSKKVKVRSTMEIVGKSTPVKGLDGKPVYPYRAFIGHGKYMLELAALAAIEADKAKVINAANAALGIKTVVKAARYVVPASLKAALLSSGFAEGGAEMHYRNYSLSEHIIIPDMDGDGEI